MEEQAQVTRDRHTFELWFYGNSLSDDYGSFECGHCGRTFYHSPSYIYKGDKTIYSCCCGHCTNEIIKRDWHDAQPYVE